MSPRPPASPTLEIEHWDHALMDGLDLVRTAHLYEDHRGGDSHVGVILDEMQHYGLAGRDRRVVALWTVSDQTVPVAMAMVVNEALKPGARPVPIVNVFVQPAYRGQGHGAALLKQVQARYPHVEGHYTDSSERLYQRAGVLDVYRHDQVPSREHSSRPSKTGLNLGEVLGMETYERPERSRRRERFERRR